MTIKLELNGSELASLQRQGYLTDYEHTDVKEVAIALHSLIKDAEARSKQNGYLYSFEVKCTKDEYDYDEKRIRAKGEVYEVFTNDFKDYTITDDGGPARLNPEDWAALKLSYVSDDVLNKAIILAGDECELFESYQAKIIYDRIEALGAGETLDYVRPDDHDIVYRIRKDVDYQIKHDDLYGGQFYENNNVDIEVFYKGERIGYTELLHLDEGDLDIDSEDFDGKFICISDYDFEREFYTTVDKAVMQTDLEREIFSEWKNTVYVYPKANVRYLIEVDLKNNNFKVSMQVKELSQNTFFSTDESKVCNSIREIVDYVSSDRERILENVYDEYATPVKQDKAEKKKEMTR